MKAFLKEYSYVSVKMFINQFAMAFFGIMLAFATASMETLLIVTSVFAILFYMFLLYTMTWEVGARDGIRAEGGRGEHRPLNGLLISLVANTPNILIAFLITVGTVFQGAGVWAEGLVAFPVTIGRFLEGMYMGLLKFIPAGNNWYFVLAFWVIILPALAISTLSYYLGDRGITIRSCFGFKNPPSTGTKREKQ